MRLLYAAFPLLFLVAVSGCSQTGQVAGPPGTDGEAPNTGNISQEQQDPCARTACPRTVLECPDGFEAGCQEGCLDGSCIPCTPSCEGHEDACAGMDCPDTVARCPRGATASCANTCREGACTSCTPECPPCTEEWECTAWGACTQGMESRNCTDRNSCGTASLRPPEERSCQGPGHVVFSEVQYDPAGKESEEEWLELYNPAPAAVALEGWTISDNSGSWTFPAVEIGPLSYLVVARDAAAFASLHGCEPAVGSFTRGLNNDGDSLSLKDAGGKEIDFVAWEQEGWDIQAGNGKSIQRSGGPDTDSPQDWLGEQEPGPAC